MASLTLQVLDGVDRGKLFRELPTPVTIGREEGNAIQLNDERVSRYHAKIQEDQSQIVLTDLESTNGTRVNGEPVQLSILRIGDRLALGRSVLLFGSPEQIDSLIPQATPDSPTGEQKLGEAAESVLNRTRPMVSADLKENLERSSELKFEVQYPRGTEVPRATSDMADAFESTPKTAPGLPVRLSPAQAAQLAELLLYLHQRLVSATETGLQATEEGGVQLTAGAWQRVLRVEIELARYLYRIGHPE